MSAFVFTSTTSVFGRAMNPALGAEAVFHGIRGLPCLILRTSRFFPEPDDRMETRQSFDDTNVKSNEFLYRRADIEDVVGAHLLALEKARAIGFGRYIVSATTPLTRDDLQELRRTRRRGWGGASHATPTSTPGAAGQCSQASTAFTSTNEPGLNSAGDRNTTLLASSISSTREKIRGAPWRERSGQKGTMPKRSRKDHTRSSRRVWL